MRCYTGRHRFYVGVDLLARTMYMHVLDANGKIVSSGTCPPSPISSSGPSTPCHLATPGRKPIIKASPCGVSPQRGRHMMRIVGLCVPAIVLLAGFLTAEEKKKSDLEAAAGWQKFEKNPVLGGALGTCFDISVLRADDGYRMWFSWRPKQSIALVESPDGLSWANRGSPSAPARRPAGRTTSTGRS